MTSPHPTTVFFEADRRRSARRDLGLKLGLMGLKTESWA